MSDKEGWNDENWYDNGKSRLLLDILKPAYGKINRLSWRLKTGRSGLLTVIAVILYQKEKGNYPTNLDELISSGYLKDVPMDPFSDKPLVYKETDDGFMLYSVGLNFVDDGGEVSRNDKGGVQMWDEESGDAVFWPVLDK